MLKELCNDSSSADHFELWQMDDETPAVDLTTVSVGGYSKDLKSEIRMNDELVLLERHEALANLHNVERGLHLVVIDP